MYRAASAFLILATSVAAVAQAGQSPVSLPAQTAFPIVFTQTVSADEAHVGDSVTAKTMQVVHLANGVTIPAGAKVQGHVVAAEAYVYDKTPYAHQKDATLSVRFDTVEVGRTVLPLHVTVRALADVFATGDAYEPQPSDMDLRGTVSLIGGEQIIPSQDEITNLEGDVVAYNRRDGVYAHLIASGRCDGSTQEASMGIFSASACGTYGYTNVSATEFGDAGSPSKLTLVSHRTSPAIVKHSTALLEVLPQEQASL